MSDRTQRVKGTAQEAKGKARKNVGSGPKGAVEETKGKANKAVGKARSTAKRATR